MSIESIVTRIENEAKAYSKDCKATADAEKKELLKEAKAKATDIKAAKKDKAEEEGKLLVERRNAVADLETRKMRLAAKQELIEECFDKALKKLFAMTPEEYKVFLEKQLADYKDKEGEILLNAHDMEHYGKDVEKILRETKLTLGKEEANIKGGFVLRKGNISYNASLDRLLDIYKSELTTEIAGTLFPAK